MSEKLVEIDIKNSSAIEDQVKHKSNYVPEIVIEFLKPKIDESLPVDKGYAWVCVVSSFIVHFFALGISYIFGVYLEAYIKDPMLSSISISNISLIGSFTSAGLPFFAIPAGNLVDRFGHRAVGIVGGVMYMVSLILASISTTYWQLLLTQGVMLGISISVAYFPALTILSQWFVEKKGFATGIAVAGSGIGGLILSPVTNWMITTMGRQQALLLSGIVGGAAIILSSLTYKLRTPLTVTSGDYGSLVKNGRFRLLYLLLVIATFGYVAPFFYLPSYAVHFNMTPSQGALAVGILNGASGAGRIILGYGADVLGHINSFTLCIFFATLAVVLIWPFATTFGTLLTFAALYGLFIGGYVSILPNVVIKMFGLENIGTKIGAIYSSFFLGSVFGPYIIGYWIAAFTTGSHINYVPMIIYSGVCLIVATFLLAITKYIVGDHSWLTRV
ncbi:hypothetical protein HDV06_003907 [Boothiomyces sp. JEL0866]|nr:hypothetical protein HDV06_003907 [Boothiomyces sp. JEL0866]